MRFAIQERKLRIEVSLWSLLVFGVSLLLSINCLTGKVDYTRCDPHGTLLTSQALLETGHLWLDPYLARSDSVSYGLAERDHHLVYYFPIGTPLLATPAVASVIAFGGDLRVPVVDRVLQRLLAALTVGLALLLLYALGCRFLPPLESLILSATFVGGSSFMSTAGTALWSVNLGLVLTVLAMWLLLRGNEEDEPTRLLVVIAAAVSLFFAFLCRPTFAIPAVLLALEVLLRNRRAGITLIATGILCTIPMALFCMREYGTILPAYYMPGRIEGHADLFQSIPGQLVSPGRGVFAYNPFLLVVLVVLVATFRRWRTSRLAWLSICWIVAHLMVIVNFHHWWGGWSYGSRLFADALPAFALLTFVLLSKVHDSANTPASRLAVLFFLAGAVLGIWINAYQGIHNASTVSWNGTPDVDIYPEKLFDWKYPQFLASPERISAQGREYYVPRLQPIPSEEVVMPDSPCLYLENWFPIEHSEADQWRWSRSKVVRIWFRDRPGVSSERLSAGIGTVGEQTVGVFCDGRALGTFTHHGFEPETLSWILPSVPTDGDGYSIRKIEFHIPGAKDARGADGKIGIGLHWLRVELTTQ